MWRALTLRWTTPTVRHEITVLPDQGTATTPSEMTALVARTLCHLLVDHLPSRAFVELLPTLLEMRDYYAVGGRPAYPQLPAVRPAKVLGRSVRPEVDLGEE
ncbi:MAG: hypothetical protein ABSE49_08480 [Polyangiaceae bacterium]|jgi:hypothetical protein